MEKPKTLDIAALNSVVRVSGLVESNTNLVKRLTALGFVQGTELEVVRRAPLGGPIMVRLLGCTLALRRCEASSVLVD